MTWDEFILKVRQGETIRTGSDPLRSNYVYSIPVNNSVKFICKGRLNRSLTKDMFLGVLDCNNNDFYKTPDFDVEMKEVVELSDSKQLEDITDEVNNILVRIKVDDFIEERKGQYLVNKDIKFKLSEKKSYDDFQLIGMGFNNYIRYCLLKHIENQNNNGYGYLAVSVYLNEGIEGLKKLDFLKHESCWDFSGQLDYLEGEYKRLSEKYLNPEKRVEEYRMYLQENLRNTIQGMKTLALDGEKIRDFDVIDNKGKDSDFFYYNNNKEYLDMKIIDIGVLQYRGTEIFSGKKEAERIKSAEFQAGIEGLIEFAHDNFEKYGEQHELEAGDLVYTNNGHFGIIEADAVYLDNGEVVDISDIHICTSIEKDELNQGLSQIRDHIMTLHKELEIEIDR